jgi:hypothetical protein
MIQRTYHDIYIYYYVYRILYIYTIVYVKMYNMYWHSIPSGPGHPQVETSVQSLANDGLKAMAGGKPWGVPHRRCRYMVSM